MEKKDLFEINTLIWTGNLLGFTVKLLPLLQICALSFSTLVSLITIYKFINNGHNNKKEI